jgi:GT2 family glycosyltransferase
MNNVAAQAATGSLLCLVNNDIEFLAPDWLTAMVRQACRPGAGAVGAKLLYPDLTVQHAGIAIGIGGAAGHMHKHQPDASDDNHAEIHVQREVSAVTGACLLIDKQAYLSVGGLDEAHFAVAFNDVDLCLKLRNAGRVNYYVPHVVAIHHESQSRGDDLAPRNRARYLAELATLQTRWQTADARDPNWNLNLDRACEQASLLI